MSNVKSRRDKLRKLVKKAGAKAILVTDESNVTYLTGFTGDSSYLLLSADDEIIISDQRYTTQLTEECPDLSVEVRGPELKMYEFLRKILKKVKLVRVAFESHVMTFAEHAELSKTLDRVELVPTSGLVESQRMIKDKGEIQLIRDSIHCAQRAFSVIRSSIRGEQTEKQVGDAIENQIRLFGGECASFPPIVAVGPRAALPHARPGNVRLDTSDFTLIDWGAQRGGYASDLTRILVTGKISPKLRKVYGIVAKAQQLAIATIRHGANIRAVDAAARNHIAKAGFGKQFGHGLGHGIGLQIHEAPRIGPKGDAQLAAGMVVTVEPGVYLPGWGGVRLEDDVLVTRSGAAVLTSVTKDLEECVISL